MGGVINPGGGAGGNETLAETLVLGAVTGGTDITVSSTDSIVFTGSTSGTTTVDATAIAGTTALTLPAATDTLVGKATTDTFTNKTFDANGTGNSLSNVDVADLANGTDGELITWDAAGAPAVVPVGTATHVLTSNGAGAAPTFQAAAAGGAFSDFKSIGTGGDYADVQAMLDASFYKGYLLSDVTEDSAVSPDANGLYVALNGFEYDVDTFQITPSVACTISFVGNGPASQFTYGYSAEQPAIVSNTSSYTVVVDNLTINNNSTEDDTSFSHGSEKLFASRIWYNIPNVSSVGVKGLGFEVNNNDSWLRDISFTGGGASAGIALLVSQDARIDNVYFGGTFIAPGGGISQIRATRGIINGVFCDTSILISSGSILNNLQTASAVTVVAFQDNAVFSNITSYSSGAISFDGANRDYVFISNCMFSALDGTDSSGHNWNLSNVYITGAVTLAGDNHQWSNVKLDSTLTVNAGSDEHKMSNISILGNVSWTGDLGRFDGYLDTAATFTLESTAANNKIDVTIDQAVTDSSGGATNSINELIY